MSFSLIKGKLAAGYPARLPASEEAADTRARPHGGHAGDRRGAIPQLEVDRGRCGGARLWGARHRRGGARGGGGRPFQNAYREVAAALAAGERFPAPSAAKLVARRSSIGGVGNLALDLIRGTLAPGPRVAVHRAGTRPHPAQAHRAIGPARPSDRLPVPHDRRPPQAPPQDSRAPQHAGRADSGGHGRARALRARGSAVSRL
jgi:hypothetical protein